MRKKLVIFFLISLIISSLVWARDINSDILITPDAIEIIRRGKLEARDEEGMTPLLHAAMQGYTNIVKLLLDNGAHLEAKSKPGYTALILAAGKGHIDTVQLLLGKNPDINVQDKYGCTALMIAIAAGHKATVQALLDRGADVKIKDSFGLTAIKYAKKYGRTEIVRLLEKDKAEVTPTGSSHYKKWKKFNRWGISFNYPESWKELSSDVISDTRSIVERNIAKDNWTSIEEFTIISSDFFPPDVLLQIIKASVPKAYTQESYLEEKKEYLKKAEAMGTFKKLNQLKGITISGRSSVLEEIDGGSQGIILGYTILCGKNYYQLQFIVNRSILSNKYNIIDKIVKNIKVEN